MEKLYAPTTIKKIMNETGFKFSKSLGQNFLIDEHIVENIVNAMDIQPDDIVIEIGPGIGTITKEAASRCSKVYAIEIDKSLIPILNKTLEENDNVEIINNDILKIDIKELFEEKDIKRPVKVIGNLPYYITTPIIMKFLEEKVEMISFTTMIQKEVADRINAKPGKKDYGALSVAVQYYCEVDLVAQVPKTVFMPQPKVDSTVIKLTKREEPPVTLDDEAMFFKVMRSGFQQRRKTLHNALSNGLVMKKEIIEKALTNCDIDPKRRAETLSIQEFAKLSNEIFNNR